MGFLKQQGRAQPAINRTIEELKSKAATNRVSTATAINRTIEELKCVIFLAGRNRKIPLIAP